MLVLNVLTVVYMHVDNQAQKTKGPADDNENLALSMDKESVLWHPLVCVHRCSPLLGGSSRAHHYPKDAVCDLLYLQLPADLSVAQVRTAPCYKDFVMIASVATVTRYGVLVDRSQSNASYWQLKGDDGMAAFVALWGARIKNHGVANLVLNTSTSTDELQLFLPLIERLRELQALLNELTGQQVERRYMMLDVRTSYTNPTVDLVTLSKLLRIAMAFPIDLLLLQTHLPADGTKPCMVVGPTTSVRAASMDAVDVPIMVCVDWASVMKAGWEMAWFLTKRTRKWNVATFDYNTTVGPKMKHAYKLYSGKRLGWAVDDVEFDLDAKDYCREAFSLVQLVAQGRPGRTPHLP
ncbi:uncharacterized protein LOC119432014 isoform X2 [Dermacentor silvarum]|uniref:uncharacterized protein LOC119432014 isoform X2 n=1 Tax=Dermacentor silvarum TaxID=543639 RepID=UPI0021013AFF|nr:uncharacterized protein LOC119432014 isoform X2 [Dermacentor silvarum]